MSDLYVVIFGPFPDDFYDVFDLWVAASGLLKHVESLNQLIGGCFLSNNHLKDTWHS
jgi:hypothetical protein